MNDARVMTLVLLAASLPAQSPERPRPYPIVPPAAYTEAIAAGTRTLEGRPGPKYWTNHARYSIAARLEPETAKLSGRETIEYQNRSPRPLTQLVLHLRQNLHNADAVRNTNVAITGGMEIGRVELDGAPLPDAARSGRGTVMYVRLPQALPPDGTARLSLDFAFTVPPANAAPRMGHEDNHVFYLGYWYPQLAVCEDVGGWVADPYLGAAEFYMDQADYEVTLEVPSGWLVQGTGELQNAGEVLSERVRKQLAEASRTTIAHVITAEDLGNGDNTAKGESLKWRFRAESVRDFAIAVSDRYLWDATMAEVAPGRTCMIHAFYRPRCQGYRQAARYARHAIETTSRLLTPYPWPHMSVCESGGGGGMEYPMMTRIGEVPLPAMMQMVVAHELIHMWWPMQVGSNETAHAWMDEGLTDFCTTLATADFWKWRNPAAQTMPQYQVMARMAGQEPMMRHGDHYEQQMSYGFCSYAKPSAVLHQLCGMVGRDRVLAALREYAVAWSGKHPLPWDFFASMNRSLGQDLDWYWRTWCYETWQLDQSVGCVREAEGALVVTIDDLGLAPHPTLVRATWPDGHTEERTVAVAHWLQGNRQAQVKFAPGAEKVEIDPDHTSLDLDPKNNVWAK